MLAVIIANGELADNFKPDIPNDAFIICADGGTRYLEKLSLKPNLILGDMDSQKMDITNETKIVYPKRKDLTDSEIAVNYVIENNYSEVLLLGFTGKRLDHSLTNIFLLKKLSENGIKAKIIDEYNEIIYSDALNLISGKKGDIVSIIPVEGDVIGISTDNLDYPLNNENLYFASGRGVSNVMLSDECSIKIKKGHALIIKSHD